MTALFPEFDADPSDEKCPDCGGEVDRDDENDWVHVLRDPNGICLALSLVCPAIDVRELVHVTGGRDHAGIEFTLCGIDVAYAGLPMHTGEFVRTHKQCRECARLDA